MKTINEATYCKRQKGLKRIIAKVMIAIITLLIGIRIYNLPANRLQRQLYLGHKYLEEQNYEQAIVEFNKAIAIDSMNVETYLGKAEAYIGMGDLSSALQAIQTGYDLTGDERLKEKLEEVQELLDQLSQPEEVVQFMENTEAQKESDCIELPFSVSDIKVQGYDLLAPHFDEVIAAFGCPITDGFAIDAPYGTMSSSTNYGGDGLHFSYLFNEEEDADWISYEIDEMGIELSIKGPHSSNYLDIMKSFCNIPIYPGCTYEEWCEAMKIEVIQSYVEGHSYNESNETYWDNIIDSRQILSKDGWYVSDYYEDEIGCMLVLRNEAKEWFWIEPRFENGIVVLVNYNYLYN